MPPPFYAYRFVVAKARAPEESISDQISKIVDATADNRYKIEVMPGVYPEAITMKQYVDVVAPYGRAVIRPPAGTTTAVTMASDCMLQGMMIDMQSMDSPGTGVAFGAVTNSYMEDCWITGGGATDFGVTDASTGTTVLIRRCRIDSAATGYKKTGTGSTFLYDNRITAANNGTDIDIDDGTLNAYENELLCQGTGYNVDVAVTGAGITTVNSFGNTLANTNTTGAGWRIADDADAKVYSHNDIFTRVVHLGAGFMVAFEEPQTYLVHNGMKIGDALTDITDASDTKRYVIKVSAGEYSEAVTMKQYVDLIGESNQSVVIYQAATNVITAAADSRIKGVRVELTAGDGKYGICCNNIYAYIEEVVIVITRASGTNYGVGSAGTGGFEIHDSVITCGNANDYPIGVDGSGTHLVYDSELINTASGAYAVFVGSADSLSSFNNKLRSAAGFYLTSDAATQVLSWNDDFTTVVFSGATGLFADLSGARLYTCAADLAIGEWVYASANDAVARADADDLATMPTIGRIVYKPSDTTCYIKNTGYAYDAAANAGFGDAWVAGQEYWVSGTPGQITTVMPAVWPQRAGVALSTQRFKILIGDNLGLVHCNEYLATAAQTVGEWVYITAVNDTVAEADASDAAKMPAIGVIVKKPTATRALVKLRGKYAEATRGWTASDDVYMDPATPGGIINTVPGIGVIQKVAEVKSDDGVNIIYELAD
jgi:hypothetical protein